MARWAFIDNQTSMVANIIIADVAPIGSPSGFWMEVSSDVQPQWWYDGATFHDNNSAECPQKYYDKAIKIAKQINKTDLLAGKPSEIGKALAVLLLMQLQQSDLL